MPLSDRDRAILDFERSWWMEPGPKESAIRARLKLSPTRYYELLRGLVTSADAIAHDPLVLRRLQRSTMRRRRARLEGPSRPATRRPAP
ncbi:MAG: DUF3263 domain-containing protein [Actinobacteria bacterium]|nr:DUF3263 domain-containing protein [Actinomycetota bacterium]